MIEGKCIFYIYILGQLHWVITFCEMSIYNVIWFRHGLRLHDNPALLEALMKTNSVEEVHLIPIYIFDGETSGNNKNNLDI